MGWGVMHPLFRGLNTAATSPMTPFKQPFLVQFKIWAQTWRLP